jgi:hypothetical protein
MKDLYTEMQELPDEEKARQELEEHMHLELIGALTELPDDVLHNIRHSSHSEFDAAVQQKFQHAKSVLLQKHKDYGPKNISLSPGGPLNGLRVRMWDKMARINNLVDSGAIPENESLKDSFLDLANYAIIAMLVLDGEWPDE